MRKRRLLWMCKPARFSRIKTATSAFRLHRFLSCWRLTWSSVRLKRVSWRWTRRFQYQRRLWRLVRNQGWPMCHWVPNARIRSVNWWKWPWLSQPMQLRWRLVMPFQVRQLGLIRKFKTCWRVGVSTTQQSSAVLVWPMAIWVHWRIKNWAMMSKMNCRHAN